MERRRWFSHLAAPAIICSAAFQCFATRQTTAEGYLRALQTLDDSRPESVCIAREWLRRSMADTNPDHRDEMFRAFRAFYIRSIDSTRSVFLAKMDGYTDAYEQWLMKSAPTASIQDFLRERPDIAKAGSNWFSCGFLMSDSEGSLYPTEDPAALLKFADRLTRSLRSYVRFRSKEDRETVIGDACLQISWEQLRLRIRRWEKFGRAHPKLPETNSEIEPEIRALALVYFFGSDNTPNFEFPSGRLDPKLVASWREFVAHDGSSRYHALISSLVKNIDEQNQGLTQRDRPLFERSGMGNEFDEWWKWFQFRLNQR